MSDLQLLQARQQLGYLKPEDVPDLATQLLVDGRDSPALRQLAGLHKPTEAYTVPLLDRAFEQLGCSALPREEALRLVIRDTARLVVDGRITPYQTAAELHGLWSDSGHPEYLAIFGAALDDYDDLPGEREAIVANIVEAAQYLLDMLPPGLTRA